MLYKCTLPIPFIVSLPLLPTPNPLQQTIYDLSVYSLRLPELYLQFCTLRLLFLLLLLLLQYSFCSLMAMDQIFQPACCNRKVKLICSFGGKFLHRPYDWTLRYAGGYSRIIIVPRDITLKQLFQKLSHAFGATVAIRYQLPNQQIDNLVSVYSEEDLQYMMEEFDNLAQPSAKLHVFLFTQSEIASVLVPSELTLIDICDGGQEYFEAVKATFSASHAAAIYSCQIRSPKATHNSDDSIHGSSSVSPAKGNLDPLSEENQLSRSFAHPLSHSNHKNDFNLPFSQRTPGFEQNGLHPLPPFNHMDCNLGSISHDKIHHCNLRHPLDSLSLLKDTKPSYGLFESFPQSLQPWHLPPPSIQPYGLHQVEHYSSQDFVEEGALHPHVDCLIKESHPGPFIDFGEHYIGKDLHYLPQLVGELLQDMLEFWESYSAFEEFKQDEGVAFAIIFSHGMEHEDEDSSWMQQVIFIKIISYVSVGNHLHMTMFERDVLTYLSNILQNFLFDPGGY